jgi:tetratricopeptide (TPR) repeat protein
MNLEQKYPIMLNLATCNYQLKNYKVAIELCDKVLAERNGTDNLKALYKKAHCLIAAGEINEAQ